MRMIAGIRTLCIALLLVLATCSGAAWAVESDEIMADAALEARARSISAGLRCLVCQNESIDDSHAPLAKDLRLLVRERLKSGDSDPQVVDFMVARYGEFILLQPRLRPGTWLLWGGPALLLAGAIAFILRARRRNAALPELPLTAAEQERVKQVLGE
jgi:cytochrome c-type biogenesis protein CcmH